jgi:hypothetical protein
LLHEVDAKDGWDITYPDRATKELSMNYWPAQIKHDLHQLGLAEYWRDPDAVITMGIDKWKSIVQRKVFEREQARWLHALKVSSMGKPYVQFKENTGLKLESYLLLSHGGWNDHQLTARRLLTSLRSGVCALRIHTGRYGYDSVIEGERYCYHCCLPQRVETLEHFLLDCSLYRDERKTLFKLIDTIISEEGKVVLNKHRNVVTFKMVTTSSRSDQIHILTCSSFDYLIKADVQSKVQSTIMLALCTWMKMREIYVVPFLTHHT